MAEQKTGPAPMQEEYYRRPLEGGKGRRVKVSNIPKGDLLAIIGGEQRRDSHGQRSPCGGATVEGGEYTYELTRAQQEHREETVGQYIRRAKKGKPSQEVSREEPAETRTSEVKAPKVEQGKNKSKRIIATAGLALLAYLTFKEPIKTVLTSLKDYTPPTPPQPPISEKKELPSQKAPIVTMSPTKEPTRQPTLEPTKVKPTEAPTKTAPTEAPTEQLKVQKTVIITAGGNAFKAFKDLGGKFGETYRFELRNKNGDVVKIREIKVENIRDLPSDVKPGETVSLLER